MTDEQNWRQRGVFFTGLLFYFLIALEFFYMASPFAIYFYGVYGPGLEWLADGSVSSSLLTFFMPHIAAETNSWLIDVHTWVGLFLFLGGLTAFICGVAQIYWRKLSKGTEVQGGLYKHIRHPQYLALMIASFGMLIIWPRFLVLIGFVVVMFLYILLARIEERRCLDQYEGYAGYLETTGAFLPRSWERLLWPFNLPKTLPARTVFFAAMVAGLIGLSYLAGLAIQSFSINNLYAFEDKRSVTISITEMQENDIADIRNIALNNPKIRRELARYTDEQNARFINYVVPTNMFISEVPMHLPKGVQTGHMVPNNLNVGRFKIIFTQAEFGQNKGENGRKILKRAINKEPIVEAWISRSKGIVEAVHLPPQNSFYNGMPVPVF